MSILLKYKANRPRILTLAISLLFLVKLVYSEEIGVDVISNDITVDIEEEILSTTEINDLSTETGNGSVKTEKAFLLPQSIKPFHYKLEVIPLLFQVDDVNSSYYNVSRFSAPGKVWIQFVCLEETSNITLHAYKDMIIETETIQLKNIDKDEIIPIANVNRDNDTDFLVLNLSQPIGSESDRNGMYSVFIEFTARIADDRLNGMYLDYYVNPDSKEKRYLSTTLFAPNHARKAFPCFDEPGFKANFSISIGRKNNSGYSSISNMPLASTKPIPTLNGWVWDEFEETLPLPTYLVALITTDFGFRSIKDGDLELKLHAPEHLIKRIKTLNDSLGLNVTKSPNPYLLQDPLYFIAASLKMWEKTKLGRYPLPKVDVIALPHFYFNAMENMGAITFKYPVILNVENVTTTSELLRLSFVAGHEVVHQWFGNMLTPKSWTYVWLKESFSDLFGRVFLSEKVNSVYKHEDFLNNELQRALRFDGGADTHPMENHIKTASAVGEIYTDIPYRKGASIMNMARNFLSDAVFKEGLETLFIEKKYSNIDQYDLFNHLEKRQLKHRVFESQGLNENTSVTDILNSWANQCGYPIVRVRREGSKLVLTQEKFKNGLLASLRADENDTEIESENMVMTEEETNDSRNSSMGYWWIPLLLYKYAGSKKVQSIQWLQPNDNETEISLGEFYSITNVEGYFRILYGKQELHSILKDLMRKYLSGKFGGYDNSEEIHALKSLERSQFLDDYFTFAFSNYDEVPITLLFHILSATLPHENDLVVWKTFFQNIQKPYKLFQNTEYFPSFQKYLLALLRPLQTYLASQKPAIFSAPCFHSSAVIRRMYFSQFSSTVLSWICAIDPLTCGDLAKNAVQKFMETEDVSTISADDQETMYCASVKYASGEDELAIVWAFFEKMYFQEYFPVQGDRYLKALSCTTNRDYLKRLLKWTVNETIDFHDVDRVKLLKYIIGNPKGREVILDFLDTNFDALYKSASVANPITEALKAMVEYINSEDWLKMMTEFNNKHAEAMEKKRKFLEKQTKNAKLNVLWMETFASKIHTSTEYHLQSTFTSSYPLSCSYESVPDFEEYISKVTDWS